MFLKKLTVTAIFSCALVSTALAQGLAEKIDNSWITISGQAVSAKNKSFVLDYGKSTVTVDVNDWRWFRENFNKVEGRNVTVWGEVSGDLFESGKIKANSVYIEDMGTYFYAGSNEEEVGDFYNWLPAPGFEAGAVTLTGRVTNVSGREFTLSQGEKQISINTLQMENNLMDDLGFQKIEKGDRVSVTGELEVDSFENREIMAKTIITLDESGRKK